MEIAKADDLILLLSQDYKEFLIRLTPDEDLQTHQGTLLHNDLIGTPFGLEVESHLGNRFYLFKPTLRDLLLQIERRSQIIYPKDIGYILLRLSIRPGARVLEAGTGSGALTTALAWAVGSAGKVYTYDRRKDMQDLAQKNLSRVCLTDRVEFRLQDIESGFGEQEMNAIFFDIPNPHDYLSQVRASLSNSGTFGVILPTTTQVAMLLRALGKHNFGAVEVCEIMLRFYKPIPGRLRPEDRMVAHTGYLIFARPILHHEG